MERRRSPPLRGELDTQPALILNLVTLDGSRLAEEVLLPALIVARAFEAKVTWLRVVPEIGVPVHSVVRRAPAADTILECVERHGADLVAMTAHDRTGLRRWLYGSVTHTVLDSLLVTTLEARLTEPDQSG